MPSKRDVPAAQARTRVSIRHTDSHCCTTDVHLAAGQYVFARRDPTWFTEGLRASAVDGGTRWDALMQGQLRFSFDPGYARDLDAAEQPLLVASHLILLWEPTVSFAPAQIPGVPGFDVVTGNGRLWLGTGGQFQYWTYQGIGFRQFTATYPYAIVDPARIASVQAAAGDLLPVPGPGGRTWIKVPTAAEIRTLS